MTETIMQCCYTNAVQEIGGKISSGWQPVAVTDNIPSEAYNGCVKLQNANSTIQSHMVDEHGNVLNLLEITGDGAYVYVCRTQYGLLDRLGRPNMFSHAYIFSWKREDVISDPNVILTLDRSNFAENEEAAANIKTSLVRNEPFTLPRALGAAGMDASAYLTLIRCVFSQYSERKAAKPIYIHYDGTEEQMQAILYCIYYGVPHYMRRNLSVASAESNNSGSKNIIFSESADKHELYLIPQTGENNVLTPRTERKIARYGFADYAARNYSSIDVSAYFAQLEKLAIEMGDPTASNELILKLAHQMLEGTDLKSLSEEELDSRLSDALRSRSSGSQRMEDYISDMLDEVRSRKMFLTEESEANLADRLADPTTSRLADAGEQYNIYRFSALSVEEAAKMLTHLAKTVFDRYSRTLAQSKKGLQILDLYYTEYALSGKEITWNELSALLDETSYLVSRRKTTDMIDAKAWELYYSLLEKPGETVSAFYSLMDLMGKLYGDGNCRQYEQTAREAYWERKTLASFSRGDIEEYKVMRVDSEKCSIFAHFYAVLDKYKLYGDDVFLTNLNAFYIRFRTQIAEGNLSDTILSKAEEETKSMYPKAIRIADWMKVAAITESEYLFGDILEVKKSLQARDYGSFIKTYQKLVSDSSHERYSGKMMKTLGKTLLSDCARIDSHQNPIPLDAWILLGTSQHTNAFSVFDAPASRPCILDEEESVVVMQSKLLGRMPYTEYAEDYIHDKGEEAKTVRKWLNERKAIEKRKRADERKAQSESEGRGRSIFSLFRSDKGSGGGKYAADSVNRGRKDPSRGSGQSDSPYPSIDDNKPLNGRKQTGEYEFVLPADAERKPKETREEDEPTPVFRREFPDTHAERKGSAQPSVYPEGQDDPENGSADKTGSFTVKKWFD